MNRLVKKHIHDTWTGTLVWGLPEGGGAGWRGTKGEKTGTTVIA